MKVWGNNGWKIGIIPFNLWFHWNNLCLWWLPKKINIEIKESVEYLEKEYSKAKGILKKDRIKTLIDVKQNKFEYQSDIEKKTR